MCITIEELNETLTNLKHVIISSLKEELQELKTKVTFLEGENTSRCNEITDLQQKNTELKEH